MGDRITVCAGCREGAGRSLAAKLGEVVGAEVRLVGCLMACGKPVAMAVSGEGKSTYLFAGVEPEAQVEEVAAFLGLYAGAPSGEIADARACGRLRFCLVGCIPA